MKQTTPVVYKNKVEIMLGGTKLIIHKKSDYDYRLFVYTNVEKTGGRGVYTGYSSIKIFNN